jgi:hypothetical protein
MEFNTKFLLFSSLGTSIYRLQVQKSVWLEKPRRCPDGSQGLSRRTTVRSIFWEFRWNSFLFLSHVRTVVPCRLDGCTSAASNFQIKDSRVRTGGMVVRTVDLMYTISIFEACASGPCWLASGRLDFECDTCLMDKRVWTGIHVVWTVATIFP